MAEIADQKALIAAMAKAKNGDKAAFAMVYQAYYVPIFRYALKRVSGDIATAEDIAQSVFIKLYRSGGEFTDMNKPPLTYLFTMTRNSVVDHWRKNGRMPTVSLGSALETSGTKSVDQNTSISIWESLKELADVERQVLVMKLVEGFSTAEIAGSLQTSEMNVRQIQCRALKKLRALAQTN